MSKFPKKPKIYQFRVPVDRSDLNGERKRVEPEDVPIINYHAACRYTKVLAEEHGVCWCDYRYAAPEEIEGLRVAYDPEWVRPTENQDAYRDVHDRG